ncbi:uncharacterized protein LOC112687612 isoform X2 [Sipha flava]|uniref:Uncharacterized protein LOC112687612 isoform X2 n=1 Tax=Sipha flava TaxID=143950 RepID=A0A2S2QV97_9HEMI|nr:uncharacterized protein LOC112687612 isoform X2 [Sipha flava]
MEASAWSMLILVSFYAKHTFQIPPDQNIDLLNPILLLPAPSGISYESLHYPMPLDQYQVVPLVINTGKIPLINHSVQAPIQYFIPDSENQRTSKSYDPLQSSNLSHQHRSTARQVTKTYSNSRTENRSKQKHYPPTTMYSETHVESQPTSRYSYGYQIIDDNIENSNDQRESSDNDNTSGNYNNKLSGLTRIQTVFEYTNTPNANTVVQKQNTKETRQKNETSVSTDSNPIVLRSGMNITKTELKKQYMNITNLETSNNVTNKNGNVTTLKP